MSNWTCQCRRCKSSREALADLGLAAIGILLALMVVIAIAAATLSTS